MYKTAALAAALLGSAEAFQTAPLRSVPAARALSVRMEEAPATAPAEAAEAEAEAEPAPPAPPAVEYSESMPFLVKRKALSGYVGDVGFDPVGFSEILPMVRARRARAQRRAPRETAPPPPPPRCAPPEQRRVRMQSAAQCGRRGGLRAGTDAGAGGGARCRAYRAAFRTPRRPSPQPPLAVAWSALPATHARRRR
jgi:hypothetical protein